MDESGRNQGSKDRGTDSCSHDPGSRIQVMIMGLECTLTIRDLQGEPPGVQCPFRLEIIMIRTVEAVPSGGRGLLQYTGSVKQIAAAF